MIEQMDPHRRDEFEADAERLGEIVRHVDVGAAIAAVGPLQTERRVIAGRADAQYPGCLDAVEGRRIRSVHQSAGRSYQTRPSFSVVRAISRRFAVTALPSLSVNSKLPSRNSSSAISALAPGRKVPTVPS